MPFAAKNMFYDERWIEKQEHGFTCWINYVLTPDDFKVNPEVAKGNGFFHTSPSVVIHFFWLCKCTAIFPLKFSVGELLPFHLYCVHGKIIFSLIKAFSFLFFIFKIRSNCLLLYPYDLSILCHLVLFAFLVVNAVSIVMGSGDKFSVPKAPTKEEMSFSTYTARRKLNRLRRSACQLFTSDAMVKAIQRLELEVEAKRLLVRKDRHLWKDIGK